MKNRLLSAICTSALLLTAFAASAGNITVPEGADVRLRMLENVSSANATAGQRFNLELEDDIKVDGVVVVPRGAKAVGTVVNTRKKGFMGKGGELNVTLDYVTVGEQRVRLRSAMAREGNDKVGTAVALTVLFGPIGLLKRGHDVELNAGLVMNAFVDEATQVTVAEGGAAATTAAEGQ